MQIKMYFRIILLFSLSINNLLAQSWSPLGTGVNGLVQKLTFDTTSQKLYAGGDFNNAGGTAAARVAVWDFNSWSAIPGTSFISAPSAGANGLTGITMYDNKPVICGFDFTNNSTLIGSQKILQNNGTNWSAFGGGLGGPALAIMVNGTDLYVGGQFAVAGGATISNDIAKWNGTQWDSVGNGISGIFAIYSMAFYNGELYAGARVTTVQATNQALYKFDGLNWSLINIDTPPLIFALQVYNNELYIAGTNYSGSSGSTLIKYNGTISSDLVSGANGNYQTLKVYKGELYIGGSFNAIGGVSAKNIAKWNGTSISALGTGTNGVVYTLASTPNNGLIAGGDFSIAGGLAANNIAIWDHNTGVNEFNDDEFNIGPNPNSGIFTISRRTNGLTKVTVTNVLGEIFFETQSYSTETLIDLSTKSKGVYFINISNDNRSITKKIIIQ